MPDGGRAQQEAMISWGLERENIEAALERSLERRASEWLVPISEHLPNYLSRICAFALLAEKCAAILKVAADLADPGLLALLQTSYGRVIWRLGDTGRALQILESARSGAEQAGERRTAGL